MPEYEVVWVIQLDADGTRDAARKALEMLRADDTGATIFKARPCIPCGPFVTVDLGVVSRPEDQRVLLYDGRYDGPSYSHPYWPEPGRGNRSCAVCGHGSDSSFDSRGNPHPTVPGGFIRTVRTVGPLAGESNLLTCPKCCSTSVQSTLVPTGRGTGHGGAFRFGDPSRQVHECADCGHTS